MGILFVYFLNVPEDGSRAEIHNIQQIMHSLQILVQTNGLKWEIAVFLLVQSG